MEKIIGKRSNFKHFKDGAVAIVDKGIIYYNKDYYQNKSKLEFDAMIEHEKVHIKQQEGLNRFQLWWFEQKYWLSKKFRYKIELEAYKAELNHYRKHLPKPKAKQIKRLLARHMSAFYNKMVDYRKAYYDLK